MTRMKWCDPAICLPFYKQRVMIKTKTDNIHVAYYKPQDNGMSWHLLEYMNHEPYSTLSFPDDTIDKWIPLPTINATEGGMSVDFSHFCHLLDMQE